MSLNIGLDLGSTAIKAVIIDGNAPLWRGYAPTAPGQEEVAHRLIEEGLRQLGAGPDQICGVAATGYGKKLYSAANRNLDEISANAAGLFKLSRGEARMIINIGGQDLKVLTLDDDGAVADFKMNDKCAAGTGRFFEAAARILDTPLEQFSQLSREARKDIEINSTCVVFAESEIVSLLARGVGREDIIAALNKSVARRISTTMGRMNLDGPVFLDGGPAKNQGLVEALEDELMVEVRVLDEPQFTVAYGAALALEL